MKRVPTHTVQKQYTVHTQYTHGTHTVHTQAPHAVHTRYTHYRTCSSPHCTACVLSSRTTLIVFPQAMNSVPSSDTCTVPILISEGCERGERGNLHCAHLNQWERGERGKCSRKRLGLFQDLTKSKQILIKFQKEFYNSIFYNFQ